MANGARRRNGRVATVVAVVVFVGACAGGNREPRLQRCESLLQPANAHDSEQQRQELDRLRASERQASDTIGRLREALARAQQELAAGRSQTQALPHSPKPIPGVQIVNDIWGGTVDAQIDRALSEHRQQLEGCYASSVQRMPSSAGWLVLRFEVTTAGVKDLKLHNQRLLDRELGQCVITAARGLRVKAPLGGWQVAQSVTFRLDRNVSQRGDGPPDFSWPELPSHMRTPVGGVCRVGSRARATTHAQPLDPFAARPCQAGLLCCYGCGVPGCDSSSMNTTSCPRYP